MELLTILNNCKFILSFIMLYLSLICDTIITEPIYSVITIIVNSFILSCIIQLIRRKFKLKKILITNLYVIGFVFVTFIIGLLINICNPSFEIIV